MDEDEKPKTEDDLTPDEQEVEDETGTSNAVLTPGAFRRFRAPLHGVRLVEIAGPVQNVDGVIHVRVRELVPLAERGAELPASHDYR